MKVRLLEFYYISHAHDTLTIGSRTLVGGAQPILWNNRGLFCVISRQKVQNILDLIKDSENLANLNRKVVNIFHWDDGTKISDRAAMKLLS